MTGPDREWAGVQDPALRERVNQVRRKAEDRIEKRRTSAVRRKHLKIAFDVACCLTGGAVLFIIGYLIGAN